MAEGGVRRLGINAGIYSIASILTQAIQFLLFPLYTRFLSPAEFGVLTFATTIYSLCCIVLGLSAGGALSRLYFEAPTDLEKRKLYGTILGFHFVVPTLIMVGIELVGRTGKLDLFHGIPFAPYLRLTIWAAYLYIFQTIPVAIYTAAQRPRPVALITIFSTLLSVLLSVYFVVVRRAGVVGVLEGQLLANAAVAVVTLWPILRESSLRPSAVVLRRALVYALPLVPHLIAGWGINLADRLILQPRVSLQELGLYSLGCQIASVVVLFATAVNSAATPMMLERMKQGKPEDVPILGTYALLVTAFVTVGTALLGGDALRLLVPARFFPAEQYVPWVAFGGGCLGLYYVCSLGTFFSMKTGLLPLFTASAAAANIALNFALIPRWGAMAAALNTFIAYLLLAVSQTILAQRLHRIDWPWRRWSRLLAATLISLAAGWWLGRGGLPRRLAVHGAATLVLFPSLLWASGFFLDHERAALRRVLRRD